MVLHDRLIKLMTALASDACHVSKMCIETPDLCRPHVFGFITTGTWPKPYQSLQHCQSLQGEADLSHPTMALCTLSYILAHDFALPDINTSPCIGPTVKGSSRSRSAAPESPGQTCAALHVRSYSIPGGEAKSPAALLRPSFLLWLSQAELVARVLRLQLPRPGSQCPPTATDAERYPLLTVETLPDSTEEGKRLVWEKALGGGRCGDPTMPATFRMSHCFQW